MSCVQVKITTHKIDLSNVTSKCGSKDNIQHTPRGGDKKVSAPQLIIIIIIIIIIITITTTTRTNIQSNLAKRPHRHLVTPRDGEWIRPILTHV